MIAGPGESGTVLPTGVGNSRYSYGSVIPIIP